METLIKEKEVKRLYGHGWVAADFSGTVEGQILQVILMGATVVNLEIHPHGQVS